MIDHKKIVEVLKAELGVKKVNFSKSDRKGGRSLWVTKIENGEGVEVRLKELVEEGKVEGWSTFKSRDGGVVGLQMMVG